MNKSFIDIDTLPLMAYALDMKMNKTVRQLIRAFLRNRTYTNWRLLQMALTSAIPQSTIHNHE